MSPAGTERRRRGLATTFLGVVAGAALLILLGGFAVTVSVVGLQASGGCGEEAAGPSAGARHGIPERYLELYLDAARRYSIDWAVLAAVGRVETDHGRLQAAGVASGENSAGAGGPMQFLGATWAQYGVDADDDGAEDRHEPSDAVHGAANYLAASGAPDDYEQAVFAYNHADWYVADVMRWAERYRGALTPHAASDAASCEGEIAVGRASVGRVLSNRRITFADPQMVADLRAGRIDSRIVATMAAIAKRHAVTISSLLRPDDADSNHSAGRAMDIAIVDGEPCTNTARGSPCGRLATGLGRVEGRMRSTELIFAFDPDGSDPYGFADPVGHADHVHVGFDD